MSARSLVLLPLLLVLLVGCDPRGLGLVNPNFRVVGHRGAPNIAPENTIPSFEVAAAVGANAIETDLCVTKDGVFVVWHDADPDTPVALLRQSGGEGLLYIPAVPPIGSELRRPVRALTLTELRSAYGYAEPLHPREPTATIPTLDGLLDFLRGEERVRTVYLDVKLGAGEEDAASDLVAFLARAIAASPPLGAKTLVLLNVERSVIDRMSAEVRRLGAPLQVAWDFEAPGAVAGAKDAGLSDVSLGLTPSFTWTAFKAEVADAVLARDRGEIETVTVWTFDRPSQLAELLYYSVDAVLTNEPGTLYRMWRETLD